MWPRGVPAPPGELDDEPVGGGRQRTLAQAHLPDVEAGVAMHGVGRVDPIEPARVDEVERPTGNGLLGGLEQQAHRQARLVELLAHRVQGQARPKQRPGVEVVPARVRDIGAHRSPIEPGPLPHRQGVEVSAQGHPKRCLVGADVGDHTGRVHGPRGDPGALQPLEHQGRRAVFLAAQFRVAVQVPADAEQLGGERVDGAGQ